MTAREPSNRGADEWVRRTFGVEMRTTGSAVGWELSDLIGLALRRNPRRAHLLVSRVLGKHVPADPALIRGTGHLLGLLVAHHLDADDDAPSEALRAAGTALRDGDPERVGRLTERAAAHPDLQVLGFAETATGLGHCVAEALGAGLYLHSTRRPVPGLPVVGGFEEGHSHATTHQLQPHPSALIDRGEVLVLVDDELSTGRTAMAAITALHRRRPRGRYVLAALVDLRSAEDAEQLRAFAAELGSEVSVVSIVQGGVELPAELAASALAYVNRAAPIAGTATADPGSAQVPKGSVEHVRLPWPASLPDGGRHGITDVEAGVFDTAVATAAAVLRAALRAALPPGARRVLVVGTEEFMYLPLRLADAIAADPKLLVRFQTTTRSPVHSESADGYPIRRALQFGDPAGDDHPRYLYNACFSCSDHLAGDTESQRHRSQRRSWRRRGWGHRSSGRCQFGERGRCPRPHLRPAHRHPGSDRGTRSGGGARRCGAAGAGRRRRPHGRSRAGRSIVTAVPLTGPAFGSYAADEVSWLLTDLSAVQLESEVAVRERAIQSGTAHYAESLPIEFQPDREYQDLFTAVLAESADRLATAVGLVTELVLAERTSEPVLVSLARAGTPVGILMRRWAQWSRGLEVPHYAVSIVRGRGIDRVALDYLARHHRPSSVVFVDGWTGKGAIAAELRAAVAQVADGGGPAFDADLAVLADPGCCVSTFGTRDDFLIASACLNSTVSGLVSRTVLNDAYIGPGDFHGAKFYRDLAPADRSVELLDAVSDRFPAVAASVAEQLPALLASDRTPTWSGWAGVEQLRRRFDLPSVNLIKPGIGETTRVLLRRTPSRVLVRDPDNPDHRHIRLLAAQRGVPVEVDPDLAYACVGLIEDLARADGADPASLRTAGEVQ